MRRPARAARRLLPGRAVAGAAALVLVALFAVDCCNGTAEWEWSDLSRAPHLAAMSSASPSSPARHGRPPVLPRQVPLPPPALVVLVLLSLGAVGVATSTRQRAGPNIGPPRRGPPRAGFAGAPA